MPDNEPKERLFLYLDILGLSNLVVKQGAVMALYERIDRLSVHNHSDFSCIVFSDTVLVYSNFYIAGNRDTSAGIMWMCEFAQDLFYRCIGIDVSFQAYITSGQFNHIKMRHLQAFYGEALIRAYRKESEIQCVGLFIDRNLAISATYSNLRGMIGTAILFTLCKI